MLRWPDATLYQGLAAVADDRPDVPAVYFEGDTWTFRELLVEARGLAVGLDELGVEPGDTVAIWLANRPAWITTQLAASYLGAAAVAVNTRYRTHELDYLLSDSESRVLVTESGFLETDYLEMVAELMPSIAEDDPGGFDPAAYPALAAVVAVDDPAGYPAVRAYDDLVATGTETAESQGGDAPAGDPTATACVFYTSGTTGDPKGCLQTNRSLLNHPYQVGVHFDLSDDDVAMGVLPFCGVWGHNVWVSALSHGVPLVVQSHYDPGELCRLIETYGVTYCSGLATMYDRMIDHDAFAPERVATLRAGAVGFLSIAYDEATFDRIEDAVGFPIVQPYGLSEANSQVFVGDPADPRDQRKQIGGPLVHPEEEDAKVVDTETGEPVAAGESGELCLRGYNVVDGYLGKPAATAEAIRDGWLHTGDLARRDDQGYFYFESRLDDALRVRGFLVAPREIEAAIDELPGVERSQVVGAPHPRHGQVPVAFVVPTDADVDAATLRSALADTVADYKIPAAFEFVESFPRSAGPHGEKIQKAVLRDRVADRFTE